MDAEKIKQVRDELSDAWTVCNLRMPSTLRRLENAINAAWHQLNQCHAETTTHPTQSDNEVER